MIHFINCHPRSNSTMAWWVRFIGFLIIGFVLGKSVLLPSPFTADRHVYPQIPVYSTSPNGSLSFGAWNDLESKRLQENYGTNISKHVVYVITPTHKRTKNLQEPELIRVAQSLMLASSFVKWMLIFDDQSNTEQDKNRIDTLLSDFNIPRSMHMSLEQPVGALKARGVTGRLKGLELLRKTNSGGVLIFADDDNTYDFELYSQIRNTSKISMWPVGCLTDVGLGSPVINKYGRVVDIFDGWVGGRKFPLDFAGFAVSVDLVKERNATMPHKSGTLEDSFIKSLSISLNDVKPLGNFCRKLLAWHTTEDGDTGSYLSMNMNGVVRESFWLFRTFILAHIIYQIL